MDVVSFELNPNYASEHIRFTNTVEALEGTINDQNVSGSSENNTFENIIQLPTQIQTSVPKAQSNYTIEQVRHVFLTNSVDKANHMYYNENKDVYEQKCLQKHMVMFLNTKLISDKPKDPLCVGIATVNRILKEIKLTQNNVENLRNIHIMQCLNAKQQNEQKPLRISPLFLWETITLESGFEEKFSGASKPSVNRLLESLSQWKLEGVAQGSDVLEYQKGNKSYVTLNTVIFGQCFLINDDEHIKSRQKDLVESMSQIQAQSFFVEHMGQQLANKKFDDDKKESFLNAMTQIFTPPTVSKTFHSFDKRPTYGDIVLLVLVAIKPQGSTDSSESDTYLQYRPFTLTRLYKCVQTYVYKQNRMSASKRTPATPGRSEQMVKMVAALNEDSKSANNGLPLPEEFVDIFGAYSLGRITDESAVPDASLLRICVNVKWINLITLSKMLQCSIQSSNE